jgi:hypothetical protein
MAESTLSETYTTLRLEAARIGNLSVSSGDWSTEEGNTLDRVLKRASQRAYWPETQGVNGQAVVHDWRFLNPMASITLWVATTGTASGTPSTTLTATTAIFQPTMVGHTITVGSGSYTITAYTSSTEVTLDSTASGEGAGPSISIAATDTYRAPDNFGELVNRMWFGPDEGRDRQWVEQRDIDEIYQMRSDEITGTPVYVGVNPVVNSVGQQRYDFVFYYQPDSEYILNYRYRILPDVVTSGSPNAYGPPWFGSVLLAAVRAEAEFEFTRQYGEMELLFNRRLNAAIARDRATGAKTLGPISPKHSGLATGVTWDRTVDVSY